MVSLRPGRLPSTVTTGTRRMPDRSLCDARRALSCTNVLAYPALQQIHHPHVPGRDLPSSHQPSDGYAPSSMNSILFKALSLRLGLNVIAPR
ncbi:hypothetical protein [Streptomyces longisporus]|uniref:hypothetical protein n=1 Tax=Streptomyces longisporus TaxID=1948 RepID=UPI0031D99187